MVKSGVFKGWIRVGDSLVNPKNIENIYPSDDKVIVCMVSGKKLWIEESMGQFLEEVEVESSLLSWAQPEIPKELTCEVIVDPAAGIAQGQLTLPAGFKVVNREKIYVTKVGHYRLDICGLLGKGNSDGQIKVAGLDNICGVSGIIKTDGAYDLVCKDSAIGVFVVCFEVADSEKENSL